MSCKIQVGFGRRDIMSSGSIELGGMGNGPFRKSENILATLYATCIAITDSEGQTLLLITTDLCHAMLGVTADARKIITEATGIPSEHIMIAATHTHAGPDVWNPGPKTVNEYLEQCPVKIAKAALAALEDRKPARVYTAMKKVFGLNFVRHYKRADGTCGSTQTPDNLWVGHMAEPDSRLRVVQFKWDERGIEKAIEFIERSRFSGDAAMKLLQEAARWSISFAAGGDKEKQEFRETAAQGNLSSRFLKDVADEYQNRHTTQRYEGRCGYGVGSKAYMTHMETQVFGAGLPC